MENINLTSSNISFNIPRVPDDSFAESPLSGGEVAHSSVSDGEHYEHCFAVLGAYFMELREVVSCFLRDALVEAGYSAVEQRIVVELIGQQTFSKGLNSFFIALIGKKDLSLLEELF